MATNNYYRNGPPSPPSYDNDTGYRDNYRSRPSAFNSSHETTTPTSFERPDNYSTTSYSQAPKRPYVHQQPSQSSYGSSAYAHPDEANHDPVGDDEAVALRPYNHKRESHSSQAPMVTPDDDPFVRDAKPGKRTRGYPGVPEPSADQGWFKGKITWCCYFFTLLQIGVFIAELVRNATLTGIPIEIKPTFNPMIGPSPYVLINMGARYQPCMREMPNVNETISWPCPNTTTTTGATTCTLAQLCGFDGINVPAVYGRPEDTAPNQWFRFITPIFLHAGIIHIGFNMLLQLTLGRDMELAIGSFRFALVYMSAGIFGFVLGGNFAATGIASTGASGSLFGILALNLLDLLYCWSTRRSPIKDLLFIVLDIAIAFVLGLLPGLDNFSHIGGFLMGLVLGICLLRSPSAFSSRLGEDEPTYAPTKAGLHRSESGIGGFARRPLAFFQGRKLFWWAWWLVRAGALIGSVVGFIVLLKNFYVWKTTCSWCKHLTCINVSNWCDIGNLQISTTANKRRRDVFALGVTAVKAVLE